MKGSGRCKLALLLCAASSMVLADGSASRQQAVNPRIASLCAGAEKTVFSCSIGPGRSVSVCASPDLSVAAGMLHLRSGKPEQLTLQLPPADAIAADWRAQVKAGQVMYAGGGGAYLRFGASDRSYVVYDATGRGWGRKSGLMVLDAQNRSTSVMRCRGPVQSQLGPRSAARAGLAREPEELELPGP